MKAIQIPDPAVVDVPINVDDDTIKVTFVEYLGHALRANPELASGTDATRRYQQIKETIASLNGNRELKLGAADYRVVLQSVRSARWGDPEKALAYLPFAEAVENAKDSE